MHLQNVVRCKAVVDRFDDEGACGKRDWATALAENAKSQDAEG